MSKKRPVNLNLFTIHFPLPAIVSILHRITGVMLFISLPFGLWALQITLHSEDSYQNLMMSLQIPWMRFLVWAAASCLIYHVVAGVRHLLMDMGIGETRVGGQISAYLVVIAAAALIITTGVWLW